MARIARIVIPGIPHLVTQRATGRAKAFSKPGDYQDYSVMLGESCRAAGAKLLAWCLMPNHVHLIIVPRDADGIRRAVAPMNRIYAVRFNQRRKREGKLWHSRFSTVAMDGPHLAAAFAYVTLNPVRAKLAASAREWAWSSAGAYLAKKNDGVTDVAAMRALAENPAALLKAPDAEAMERLRKAERIGRPVGGEKFIARLEKKTGRILKPQKRGPKPKL